MSSNKQLFSNSFDDAINKEIDDKINKMYSKVDDKSEFEVLFFKDKTSKFGMNMEQYLKYLKYLKFMSQKSKLKLIRTVELDISYSDKNSDNFRISISGIENINKYIRMLGRRKNHVIYSALVGLSEKNPEIRTMKKVRGDIINIEDFDMRVRLASENKLTQNEVNLLKNLHQSKKDIILYRYKDRISLEIVNNSDVNISIDLTSVKSANDINHIENSPPSYELEIDLSSKKKGLPKKYLDNVYGEISNMLKVAGNSNYIVSNSVKKDVLKDYQSTLDVSEGSKLDARQTVTLEIQHVVDKLPNKYAVTDKADGDRAFLIVHEKNVFIIFNLLDIVHTGITLNKEDYNHTILDGEFVFISSTNRHVFLVFDCLYRGKDDIRQTTSFLERLKHAQEVINDCFNLKDHKNYQQKYYDGKYEIDKILTYYDNDLQKYMDALNHDIKLHKTKVLVRRKFFIPTMGGQNNEIFKYSSLIWNKYKKDKNINCPYILDGLIYQPLNQKYITSAKSIEYFDYKWKPQEKNSIDFYIKYQKYKGSNKPVIAFDNSTDEEEQLHGKPYKIINLYVGKRVKGAETYTLFEPEKDMIKYEAFIYLKDGEARDLDGNIIVDSTVVEFYYNNDPNIPDNNRWVPMRTRYDKTELVNRFKKGYGNYSEIAYRNWRSIKNPFYIEDINILSNDLMFDKHFKTLRGKIDHSIILSEFKENKFNLIRTNLGNPMRNFKNWIESILLYTYANFRYEPDQKKLTVLDIACGMGRDMMKYYYVEILLYVGIDINSSSLNSPVKGAISRYNQLRKTHDRFPKMNFIQANASVPFNYEEQTKALGGMSDINKKLIEQYFPKNDSQRKKFDRITCQYSIQYFLENEITWNNFLKNLNDYLLPDGYFIFTTLDADVIVKLLGNNDQYIVNYTNNKGEQNVLFEIVKKYSGIGSGDLIQLGKSIDFHDSFESHEGVYINEHLVQKKFVVQELENKCNMQLIDTDLFQNQYDIHKFFFHNTYKFESNEKTLAFFEKVAKFINDDTDVNNACRKLIGLYRYYIFRKVNDKSDKSDKSDKLGKSSKSDKSNKSNKSNKSSKKQSGGSHSNEQRERFSPSDKNFTEKMKREIVDDFSFNEFPLVFDPSKYIKKNMNEIEGYSFSNSIHDILRKNEIIPPNIGLKKFFGDINQNLLIDGNINDSKINKFIKKLRVEWSYSDTERSNDVALNGLRLFILDSDCDGNMTINKYGSKCNKNAIIYFDGNSYHPIYEVKNDEMRGLFDDEHKIIKSLLNEM